MKRDIDALLRERGLSAALILRGETPNPTFRFMAGPPAAHITSAILVCRPGQKPHLVHAMMERDSAEATGFELSDFGAHGFRKILEDEGSRDRAMARLLSKVLDESGREGSGAGQRIRRSGTELPHDQPASRIGSRTLRSPRTRTSGSSTARAPPRSRTKSTRSARSPDLRRAYARVREVIGGGRLDGGKLKDAEGWVTIGRLRREIRRVFFEADLEEPHGNIIAMGRDAGVPHNIGNDGDVLEEGRSIVIDLYPVQAGGGYYFDVTRTDLRRTGVSRAQGTPLAGSRGGRPDRRRAHARGAGEDLPGEGVRPVRAARPSDDPTGREASRRVHPRTGSRDRARGARAAEPGRPVAEQGPHRAWDRSSR